MQARGFQINSGTASGYLKFDHDDAFDEYIDSIATQGLGCFVAAHREERSDVAIPPFGGHRLGIASLGSQ